MSERLLIVNGDDFGLSPAHLDSHHHVHREQPVTGIVLEAAERLGVPVRDFTPGIAYDGSFYGQDERCRTVRDAISVTRLIDKIEKLPAGRRRWGVIPPPMSTMIQATQASGSLSSGPSARSCARRSIAAASRLERSSTLTRYRATLEQPNGSAIEMAGCSGFLLIAQRLPLRLSGTAKADA